MPDGLRFVIRTPHQVIVDTWVTSARIPTPSGHLGLRPRGEPLIVVVDAGVILLQDSQATRYAATAGGLLESTGKQVTLCTPFGVTSSSQEAILDALTAFRAVPDEELLARQKLQDLENRIVREFSQRSVSPKGATPHHD